MNKKRSSSKQKWGILKYLPAEISSETTEISGLKDEKKELKNRSKMGYDSMHRWHGRQIWQLVGTHQGHWGGIWTTLKTPHKVKSR